MRRTGRALLLGGILLIAAGCGGAGHGRDTSSAAPGSTTPGTRVATAKAACPTGGGEDSRVKFDRLPPATKTQVDDVRAAWAHKFPTAADADRAGWFKTTPNLFGI